MVLPPFTPARSIFPTVGLLPMQEQGRIADGNREFDFTSKVCARI